MGEILEIKRKDGAILQGQFKLLEEKDIKDIQNFNYQKVFENKIFEIYQTV